MPDFEIEDSLNCMVAGVDEAGRGPWAGPVVAGAVIIRDRNLGDELLKGLDDSKKISAKKRELLYEKLREEEKNGRLFIGIGQASAEEIDRCNILQATFAAMKRAVEALKEKGISVTIKVDNVNLNFIEPIDITTIFGNLLDNAIEAAEKLEGEKYISIKIGSYHKMIAASIENNCGEVKWKNGFPVSAKGKGGGIGLLNVQSSVKKYDGNLILKSDGNKFIAELFLNS